jgi:hypothetical protein
MILRAVRRSSSACSTRGVFVAAWLTCNRTDYLIEENIVFAGLARRWENYRRDAGIGLCARGASGLRT